MNRIAISRTHYPVSVLGHGIRAGIWVQGCALACPGCMSQDTWEAGPDHEVGVAELLTWISGLPDCLDGVTISGGEPFQQPEALATLLTGLRDMAPERPRPLDLLVYSGFAWSRLARSAAFRPVLEQCDAVVAGPYVERRNTGVPLRGSDNQVVVPLTRLGHERYGPEALDEHPVGRLQASVDAGQVWLIGIPRRQELHRWEQRLLDAGATFSGASWNS